MSIYRLKQSFFTIINQNKLIGAPEQFTLESRIFHSICLSLITIATIYIPYNFYIGLYFGSFSAFVFFGLFCYQYYRSRFNFKKPQTGIFAVAGLIIFGANYFTNSGIDGSTDLIWPAYLLVLLAISPYRLHIFWLCVYIVAFAIIHWVEFQYPNLIQHPFYPGKGQFLDRITAFPIPVLVVFTIVRYIRKSYDIERIKAVEKTKALEHSNAQISLQNQQLEKSNDEKNKLMSIISHDLRSPLINIQSYLYLLNNNEIALHERESLEKSLLSTTNGAVEMLSNFLHWAKSQMQGVNPIIAKHNLYQVIKDTLSLGHTEAQQKGISFDAPADQNISVLCDADMLQIVLRNLINNAIKFTPTGGRIKIATKLTAETCVVSVADNGIGIPQETQAQLFSIKTSPSFGTHNEKGMGLGLVLCREFMQHQHGDVTFESSENGSTFFIQIPLHES